MTILFPSQQLFLESLFWISWHRAYMPEELSETITVACLLPAGLERKNQKTQVELIVHQKGKLAAVQWHDKTDSPHPLQADNPTETTQKRKKKDGRQVMVDCLVAVEQYNSHIMSMLHTESVGSGGIMPFDFWLIYLYAMLSFSLRNCQTAK